MEDNRLPSIAGHLLFSATLGLKRLNGSTSLLVAKATAA